jgi:hypothetical protein
MTHTFKSTKWLGYAALTCAALLFFATRLRPGPEPLYILAIISLFVFGIYCGIRGLFSGTLFNRVCAGASVFFLIWMVLFFLSG